MKLKEVVHERKFLKIKCDYNICMHYIAQQGTGKDQEYDFKDGCEDGDDVWTGVSSDDKETGEAAKSS